MTTFVLSALLNIPLQSKIRAFNYSLQLAANRLNVRLRNRNLKKRTNCTYRRKIWIKGGIKKENGLLIKLVNVL